MQVSIDKSAVDPSAGDQSAVCRSAGQQSGIGNCSTVPPGASIYLPPGSLSQLGVVLKINEISMHIQHTRKSQKWSHKTSQSVQNEVPRGTRSHQNNEESEKVKSNENTCIYHTFEGLGHENSAEFPFKNQQKT